jgi:hypothetical protein
VVQCKRFIIKSFGSKFVINGRKKVEFDKLCALCVNP